jgi:hypothetical protein
VAKVNLPLSDGRLRLFLEGKEDWLEEGLLVSAKKKIGSSMAQEGGAQQNYVPPFGGIPAPPSYYGDVPMQVSVRNVVPTLTSSKSQGLSLNGRC